MGILIAGGGGYLGGHLSLLLAERGEPFVVLDRTDTPPADIAHHVGRYRGDVRDIGIIEEIVARHDVNELIYLASDVKSRRRSRDEASGAVHGAGLFSQLRAFGIGRALISSSMAVYKDGKGQVLTESSATEPATLYGLDKYNLERAVDREAQCAAFKYAVLRFSNIAGADRGGRWGPRKSDPGFLIPTACKVALGLEPQVNVYGRAHPTPDGTCVRDYLHPTDAAQAIVMALDGLRTGRPSAIYNCSTGQGASVDEVLELTEEISGNPVRAAYLPARPDEIPSVVGSSERLTRALGWRPVQSDLRTIISSALAWEHARAP